MYVSMSSLRTSWTYLVGSREMKDEMTNRNIPRTQGRKVGVFTTLGPYVPSALDFHSRAPESHSVSDNGIVGTCVHKVAELESP